MTAIEEHRWRQRGERAINAEQLRLVEVYLVRKASERRLAEADALEALEAAATLLRQRAVAAQRCAHRWQIVRPGLWICEQCPKTKVA